MGKRKVLLLCEGPDDKKLMLNRLFQSFADKEVTVVTFKTNIYQLYRLYKEQNRPFDDLDLVSVLRSDSSRHFTTPERDALADGTQYSDIYLIFDLDPHDAEFTFEKILTLMAHFNDSTGVGRLYINYPMVESFQHLDLQSLRLKGIDSVFMKRTFSMKTLSSYKKAVNIEGFQLTRNLSNEDLSLVIKAHAAKMQLIEGCPLNEVIDQNHLALLLSNQCSQLHREKTGFVLNTACFLIPDLYPHKVPLNTR